MSGGGGVLWVTGIRASKTEVEKLSRGILISGPKSSSWVAGNSQISHFRGKEQIGISSRGAGASTSVMVGWRDGYQLRVRNIGQAFAQDVCDRRQEHIAGERSGLLLD